MINNTDLCSGNHTTERGASWPAATINVPAAMSLITDMGAGLAGK
jgi:hypothetical protein